MRSGPFDLLGAITLDDMIRLKDSGNIQSCFIPPNAVLGHLLAVELSEEDARKVYCGVSPACHDENKGEYAILEDRARVRLVHNGKLLAVAEIRADKLGQGNKSLRLIRVFN